MTFRKALTIGAIAVGSVIVLSMISPWFRAMLLFGGSAPVVKAAATTQPLTTP